MLVSLWANVLYHPRHLPVGGIDRNSLDRPCTSQLLGDANSEPCVFLADLNHAARWTDLHGRVHPRRNEKTGTLSWISVELASKVAYTIPYAVDRLKQIYRRVEQYNALFLAAFPRREVPSSDGKGALSDNGFLDNFAKVIAKERKRYLDYDSPDWQPRLTTYPATAHVPRHDCESYYWILLYHLARAYPLGDADKPSLIPPPAAADDAQKVLETFATAMLEHEVGQEGDRQKYLYGFDHQAGMLHPKLQGCAPLLQDLAAYLIDYHASVKSATETTIRRLILLEIIQLTQANPAIPNVRFSTAGPRRLQPKIIDRTKGTPSQSAPELGAKRGRSNDEGDDHDQDSDPKRLKTAQLAVVEMRRSSRLASLSEENSAVRTDSSHDDIVGLQFDADDSDSFDEDTHDDSGIFAVRKRVKKAARDPADATVAECIQYYHHDARWFSTGVQAKK
ncbi:hypothetical protein EXIGLDRAFT_767281 [Exidia glandulosa HHB12029]|uniref:Fungal-type protein kinase domain-containing protein n=1 Tax=Exidia glandulosa HHB12029 TaxID=1314781 RepID=A0A165J262_EXIGL|nr:hypothetical protein EXIGLDRAFT_767281 [Exidia glandulosa HHB12029]